MRMNRRAAITAMAAALVASAGIGLAAKGKAKGAKQVVVNGTAQNLSATGFDVLRSSKGAAAMSVVVTDTTQYLRSDGTVGAFADVVDGGKVQVKGAKPAVAGEPVTAVRVLIKQYTPPAPPPPVAP